MVEIDFDIVSRYRQVRTEEEGIALAREEGVPEDLIQRWTPGWKEHYVNTARTIVHTARQLRKKLGNNVIPFPEPPQPPGGVPMRQRSVRKTA